jgi:hypothetical protein
MDQWVALVAKAQEEASIRGRCHCRGSRYAKFDILVAARRGDSIWEESYIDGALCYRAPNNVEQIARNAFAARRQFIGVFDTD